MFLSAFLWTKRFAIWSRDSRQPSYFSLTGLDYHCSISRDDRNWNVAFVNLTIRIFYTNTIQKNASVIFRIFIFNIVLVMCEKCIFALYIYDNIFRVRYNNVYINTFRSHELRVRNPIQIHGVDISTRMWNHSFVSQSRKQVDLFTERSHIRFNERKCHTWYVRGSNKSYLVKRFQWHVQKCTYSPDKLRRSSIPTY